MNVFSVTFLRQPVIFTNGVQTETGDNFLQMVCDTVTVHNHWLVLSQPCPQQYFAQGCIHFEEKAVNFYKNKTQRGYNIIKVKRFNKYINCNQSNS